MNTGIKTRVVKNTLFVLVAQITNILLQMLYLIVTARYLGNVQFGKLSFALAFTQMFLPVTDLGLFNYVVREISRKLGLVNSEQERDIVNRYFVNLLASKAFLGLCVLTLIASLVLILGYPTDTILAVYLLGIGLCLYSLNTSFHAIFQSYERLVYISVTMILFFAVNVLLSCLALFMGKDIIALAVIHCIAGIVMFVANLSILCKKFFLPKLTINIHFCREMLIYSIPIGIGAVSWSFYNRIDATLLALMKGDASVGEYTAAYRLTNTLAFIPSAYLSAVFPIIANQYNDKPNLLLSKLCQKSCRFMFIIAFPLAFVLAANAPAVVELLYGKTYLNSVISLRILSCTILFTFVSSVLGYLLLSTYKTSREYTLYAILGLIINIFCNCLLIPRFDLHGAAISTVITECCIFMFYAWSITQKGFRLSIVQSAVRPLLACLPAVCIAFVFDIKNIFVFVPLSFIIYAIALFTFGGIQRSELREITSILKGLGKT